MCLIHILLMNPLDLILLSVQDVLENKPRLSTALL